LWKKPAIVFCDNCSAQCLGEVLRKLTGYGILVIAYPLYPSHIFQVLDVFLFGILKKAKKYQQRNDTLRREVYHVLWLSPAHEQATTFTAIKASWLKTGFDYETREAAAYLIVNEAKIRQGDAVREIWLFDYYPFRISKQPASQR
jgi:hypothetical protein